MATPSVASDSVLLAGFKGNAARYSDYSISDSFAEHDAELREYRLGLKRLEDEKMQSQRYQLSQAKRDEQSALALVGKVQRSLERRYHNQDAEMRPKKTAVLSEKVA